LYPTTQDLNQEGIMVNCKWMAAFAITLCLGCSDGNPVSEGGSDASVSSDGLSSDSSINNYDSGGISQDTSPPEVGEFGYTCVENDDCDSGLCIQTRNGKICTKTCVDTCPSSFKCVQNNTGSGDNTFICVDKFLYLCNPCETNGDCTESGGGNKCISWSNAGKFCGSLCKTDADCPGKKDCTDKENCTNAYSCVDKQCMPTTGECSCSNYAKGKQLQTSCSQKADFASCIGKRTCNDTGLSKCEFNTKPETCNGLDDDCNGKTDETTCDDGNVCTDDLCKDGKCKNSANTADCDFDSQCHTGYCSQTKCLKGNVKKCDDGNPCTQDYCDNKLGCTAKLSSGSKCKSDGNQCTTDVCVEGSCEHKGHTKACDDDDPCTLDEHCDANKKTCTVVTKNKTDCKDGNPCTNDLCVKGVGCKFFPKNKNFGVPDDTGLCPNHAEAALHTNCCKPNGQCGWAKHPKQCSDFKI
jgi:hypothetical protein